jgi:hypothetical protein
MEKTAIRNNLNTEKEKVVGEKIIGTLGTSFNFDKETVKKVTELREPIDAEYRQKFQEQVEKVDREYQREKERQESIGETLSRITPTSSLIYLAMNLSETGKIKRNTYFQTGIRYYAQLEEEYFSDISDDDFHTLARFVTGQSESKKITPPPDMADISLSETLRHSVVDLLLLCFLAMALTTIAFLKFFRLDI